MRHHTSAQSMSAAKSAKAISGSIIQNSARCREVLLFSALKVGPAAPGDRYNCLMHCHPEHQIKILTCFRRSMCSLKATANVLVIHLATSLKFSSMNLTMTFLRQQSPTQAQHTLCGMLQPKACELYLAHERYDSEYAAMTILGTQEHDNVMPLPARVMLWGIAAYAQAH